MKAAILTDLLDRPLGASRLAGMTGMNYTNCMALLSELRQQGMITRVENKYQITEAGAAALAHAMELA